MAIFMFQADELYRWIAEKDDFILLDVRNKKDFGRFPVEGPYPVRMLNVSYFDFMEIEDECVARLPEDRAASIRIVCAKEGSAKFVAEILEKHGYTDVGYLSGGIKSWGNLLVARLLTPDKDYALYQFIRPGKGSCSYGLLYRNELMLFDPSRNVDFYLDFAEQHEAAIVKTVETHLQADYISGSRLISERTGAEICANTSDFGHARLQFTAVQDHDDIGFADGGPSVRVIFAPGHTPGSTMYLIADTHLITGDIVFIKSIGRPDLGGKVDEWSVELFKTIRNVSSLNESFEVLPGHFIDWGEANDRLIFSQTLDQIKRRNEDIYAIADEDDFSRFIKDNMRDQPPEYATIRLVNANLEQVDDEQAEILDLGKNECAASAYAAAQQQQQ